MKCLAIDRNKQPCRVSPIGDARFCKFHEYMCEYTESMLSALELCSGCKKAYCFETTETKTCDKCKNRSKTNRVAERQQVVLCLKEGCKFKKSEENKYCKLHQIQLFVDETTEENKKMCANYIRGCRAKLEKTYMFSRCQDCLAADREKDRAKRGGIREQNTATVVVCVEKGCTVCCKILPIEEFRGIRREFTATCRACRDDNKIQDLRRDKEHRNELARVNDAKPERIEVKKQWKEDNYEKVAEYCINSRQHKIERIGIDEYLKENAEQSKMWRENNPEKQKEFNIKRHNSYETQYDNYRRSAELKQLVFAITFDEYSKLVKNPCHYCGVLQNRGFNGVDRENSAKGYILENCVSCCKMCNYMKNTLTCEVFVNRVEHILTYNKIIAGQLYPEIFADFTLMPIDYDKITNNCCYMCGKENTKTHKNGIDRYDNDNNVGYILENCRPCCGECNYMKRDYSYADMIEKFKMIYEYNNSKEAQSDEKNEIDENITGSSDDDDDNITPSTINQSLIKGNKKTQEQINEQAKIRKQKQREILKEKYGNEEYKKIHAQQIADNRKKNSDIVSVQRTPEQIRETNRIRKQRQYERDKMKKEQDNNIAVSENTNGYIEQPQKTQEDIDNIETIVKPQKTLEEIREANKIRKQKQREREQKETPQIETNLKPQKTPEEIREANKLRKQKQREREHNERS